VHQCEKFKTIGRGNHGKSTLRVVAMASSSCLDESIPGHPAVIQWLSSSKSFPRCIGKACATARRKSSLATSNRLLASTPKLIDANAAPPHVAFVPP